MKHLKPPSRRHAYSDLIDDIRKSMAEGALAAGDRLASEGELAKAFGISIRSVRAGIDILIDEGVLDRRQGSGTYVLQTLPKPAAAARRDTVIIASAIHLNAYHPYYSELESALQRRLAELGWNTADYAALRGGDRRADVAPVALDAVSFAAFLEECPGAAGAVIAASRAAAIRQCVPPTFPLAAFTRTPDCPFVAYDWDAELLRAFEIAIADGARRIWGLVTTDEAGMAALEQTVRALRECYAHVEDIAIERLDISRFTSLVTGRAFERTVEAVTAGARYDAVVAGDDFLLRGVLEGLEHQGRQPGADLRVIALVNRHSTIQPSPGFTLLEADGERSGTELAELMDGLIRSPRKSPGSVTLAATVRRW